MSDSWNKTTPSRGTHSQCPVKISSEVENFTSFRRSAENDRSEKFSTGSDPLERIPLLISEEIKPPSLPVIPMALKRKINPDIPQATPTPTQDPPTITVTPDEAPPITIMSDEPPIIIVMPDESPPITVMPDEPPPITITPVEPPVITIMPDEPPPITIMPDEPPVITIMPDEPPPITIMPDEPPVITIMPDEPPPITIMPDEPPPITITPVEPPAITVTPDEPQAKPKEDKAPDAETSISSSTPGTSSEPIKGQTFRVSKSIFIPVTAQLPPVESKIVLTDEKLQGTSHSVDGRRSVPLKSSPNFPSRTALSKSMSGQDRYNSTGNGNTVYQAASNSKFQRTSLGQHDARDGKRVPEQKLCQETPRSVITELNKYIALKNGQKFSGTSCDKGSHEAVVEASAGKQENKKFFVEGTRKLDEQENKDKFLVEEKHKVDAAIGLPSLGPLKLNCIRKNKVSDSITPVNVNLPNQQSIEANLPKNGGYNFKFANWKTSLELDNRISGRTFDTSDSSADWSLCSSAGSYVKSSPPTHQNKIPPLLSFNDILKRTLASLPDSNFNRPDGTDETSERSRDSLPARGQMGHQNEKRVQNASPAMPDSGKSEPSLQPTGVLSFDERRQEGLKRKDEAWKPRKISSSLDDADDSFSEQGEEASLSSNEDTDEVFISQEKMLKRQNHVKDEDFQSSSKKGKSKAQVSKSDGQEDSESEVEISNGSESEEDLAQLAENEASADDEMVRLIKEDRTAVKVVKGKSIKFSDNHHVIELESSHRRNSDSRLAQLISYGASMKKKSRKFVRGKDSGTCSTESPTASPKVSTNNLHVTPHRKPNLKKTTSFGSTDIQTLSPLKNVKGSVSVQSSPRVKHRQRVSSVATESPSPRAAAFRSRCQSVDERSAPGVCLVCNEWVGVHHDPHNDGSSNRASTGDVLPGGENGSLSCGSPYNTVSSLPSSPITPHIVVSLDEDPPARGEDFQEVGQDLPAEDGNLSCPLAKSKSLGSCEDLGGSKSDLSGRMLSDRSQMARHNSISSYLMPEIEMSMQRKTRRNSMLGMMQRASSVNNISLTAAPAQLMRVPSTGTLRHGASKTSLAPSNCDWRREGNDSMISCLSALYGKILVVMGLAFPIGEFISGEMPLYIFKGFYLYLHLGSIIFLVYAYMFLLHVVPLPKVEIKSRLQNLKASTADLARQLSASLNIIPQEDSGKGDVERVNGAGRNDDARSTNTITTFQNNKNYTITESTHESMYLKMGAMVFGIGSMIYSGLEVGQYFDLKSTPECADLLLVVSPVSRMLFTFIQMYFIFLNSRVAINKHRTVARFGLMHMIATNLCIWLNVLVEETKHEIHSLTHVSHGGANKHVIEDDELYGHGLATVMTQIADAAKNLSASMATTLAPAHNLSAVLSGGHHDDHFFDDDDDMHSFEMDSSEHHLVRRAAEAHHTTSIYDCRKSDMMSRLVDNASPFLFPCTIEYSLLCSGVLYVIWKNINKSQSGQTGNCGDSDISTFIARKARHHYSVDCAHATRGLFMGILVLVLTIISLILFFVLINNENTKSVAILEANIIELSVYSVAIITVVIGMVQMRELEFVEHGDIELDNILLLIAQTGTYIYTSFTIIGGNFSLDSQRILPFFTAVITLIQTTLQTLFILNASRRCCYTYDQLNRKPGREMVTFLLICNLAMWAISTFETSRADAHPTLLNYYGVWAWTIISHVSMPLAIFYRFHVTVCLCEIWKRSYKLKHDFL